MRRSLTKLFVLSIPLSFFFSGCFDKPGDLVAPSWDVNMGVPVMNKTYTIKDMVEKDENFIKWYPEGSPMANQLYYADNKSINPVTIGDNVKLSNTVSSVTSQTIGEIKIQDPPSVNSDVDFSFDSNIRPGMTQIFPPESNVAITVTLPQQNEFNYFYLSGGTLNLTVKSELPSPVTLTLSNIALTNKYDDVTVGSYSGSISIPAGQTKSISINLLTNKKIYNQLVFGCSISTSGSGLQAVTVPSKAMTVNASLSNLAITQASGKLKGNSIYTSGSVKIDEQSMYTNVVIDKGSLRLAIKNNIDVAFDAKLKLYNIYKDQNSGPFELPIRVERKGYTQIVQPLDNFIIKSNTPTSSVNYDVVVNTEATSDYRVISSSNSFTDTLSVGQLSIRSFTGIVKPTTININPTTVTLNLKDLKDKFKFNKINFKDPDVKIYLKPTSDLKVRFDGVISAKGTSNKVEFSDYISKSGSAIDSVIVIPGQKLADFLSGFTPNLPDELIINGSATVNPDFEQVNYSFTNTDQITGYAEVKFPLNVGIDNGQFTDTTDYEKDIADSKKEIGKIKSVVVTLEISNGIAAKVRYDGAIYDATRSVKLLDLLPNRPNKYIEVAPAQVNSSGEVTAPAVTKEVIELTGSDVEKFLNGKFILSNVNVNTSGAVTGNPQPVQFKTTDAIKIKAFGKVVYKVSSDN
ncbi:MAG: hypothetical protein Q8858_13920 [Bacteroidota bacterium]|nr:hypothetical protein [Bacteroidota bacterium]MDP4194397.1 hypothetical protein [Bacteroidota bacterium]